MFGPSPLKAALSATARLAGLLDLFLEQATHFSVRIDELSKEGIYDEIPSIGWEQRKTKGAYLRLTFPTQADGRRRKLYIGSDPTACSQALNKRARTLEHNLLTTDLLSLQRATRSCAADLCTTIMRLGPIASRMGIDEAEYAEQPPPDQPGEAVHTK